MTIGTATRYFSGMGVMLVGYRGSGKTTIGRLLAERLRESFLDSDEMVIGTAGRSIKAIFEEQGEAAFRTLEAGAVRDVCRLTDHVISVGGGAILLEENRAAIKASGHRVIYLRCEADELHKRVLADVQTAESRPSLTPLGGGIDEITALLARREPLYRDVMTAELDVTHLTPDDAVGYIVGRLGTASR